MSKPRFIYLLQEKDGRYRQIKNGVVTSLTTPWALPHAPDGNQDIRLGWERSSTYHGTIPAISLELGFVLEGRRILKNDLYKNNIDRELWLLIKKLTYSNDALQFADPYKTWYSGQIDFSTAEDDHEDQQFKVNILEGGLRKLINANETTQYTIPFGGDAGAVYMDGMFIRGGFKFFIAPFETLSPGYPSLTQLNNDNPIPGLALFDVPLEFISGTPDENSIQYFATATQDIPGVKITGLINGLNPFGVSGPLSVTLYVFNSETNTVRQTIDLTPDDPYPADYSLVIDQTVDLLKGDRLFLKSASAFSGEGELNITAKSKAPASFIPGYTLFQLGQKLIEKIAGDPSLFTSVLLQELEGAKDILITSGDGVRNLPGAGIKTTWRDYWKAVNAYKMAECQITTEKINIEARQVAYNPVQSPVVLGEVKKLKVNPAIDQLFTSIKVGHKEQQVDDTNGRFDFNGFMIFKTPITAIESKELDLTSPWKASPFEIEQTRANYEGKTTTDKEGDNDNYAIAVIANDAANTRQVVATFYPGTFPLLPGKNGVLIPSVNPLYRTGQRLRFSGTVNNNIDATVVSVTVIPFFGQFIELVEPVTAETTSPGFATIEVLSGKFYTLDRSIIIDQLVSENDVDEETRASVFNAPLSPKRMLERHYPWIAGMCWNYGSGELVFTSANRNADLIAGGLIEKANVPVAALGAPMWLPYYFDFDTEVAQNMAEVFTANPFPLLQPSWKGVNYPGFIMRAGIAPNTEEEQNYKTLLSPLNDIESLILA